MKRILLFLVGVVIALSMFAQKSTSVRSFEYPDYVTPHPYDVRKATLGGESLTISYYPNTGYGIKFRYMFRNINISVKFITSGNGKYVYTGTDSSGNKTVVATKRKLSDFLDNVGQTQSESFERDKEIEITIYGIGDLSIYPFKKVTEQGSKKSSSCTYQGYYTDFMLELEVQNQRCAKRAPLTVSYNDRNEIYTVCIEKEAHEIGQKETIYLKYSKSEKDKTGVITHEYVDVGNRGYHIRTYKLSLYEFAICKGIKDPNEVTSSYFRLIQGDSGIYIFPSLVSIPSNYKSYEYSE